ncbi:AaceriAAL086Wp [[Ashbya] aceris (nom. inval.)]|nr:AaceriAAL086Wp [[Ashbya] aceris (nom. inval.)]
MLGRFVRRIHVLRVCNTQHNVRLQLFSKEHCGLCDNAKVAVANLLKRPEYEGMEVETIDITLPENKTWWEKYCLDVPVLHVENKSDSGRLKKIFHRVQEQQLIETIKEVEK